MEKTERCKECGCEFKTKFMIRVDFDKTEELDFNNEDQVLRKKFFEATNKRSIVGWMKHIMDSGAYNNFEDITITDLTLCCEGHKEFYLKEKQ